MLFRLGYSAKPYRYRYDPDSCTCNYDGHGSSDRREQPQLFSEELRESFRSLRSAKARAMDR